MSEEPKVDRLIDARNTFCPGPLMELIRAVREAKVGEVIGVLSSDTGSKKDIPLWVNKAGHKLVGIYEKNGYSEMEISKKREALENVLIPYRIDENLEMFRRNGFGIVETFFQWYNFVGFMCLKTKADFEKTAGLRGKIAKQKEA